jgi:hypothetical protein
MVRGWVYVIVNEALPGLVKIGFSLKDPVIRARELNHTGAPHPYAVAYDALVNEPRELEQRLHIHLNHAKEGKEWFKLAPKEAVAAIRKLADELLLENLALPIVLDEMDTTVSGVPHEERCQFEGCILGGEHHFEGQLYCRWHFRELSKPEKAAAIRMLREEQEGL